tara:strand:+ start:313 stop:873 length:561 start_codon:yes stop_codon:yes gene_type:complete
MIAREMTDLALLGVSRQGPILVSRVVNVMQSLIPDLWRPTVSVIEGAIKRNIDVGNLQIAEREAEEHTLILTPKGEGALMALIRADPGDLGHAMSYAAGAIQIYFLDTADAETANFVLKRLKDRTDRRLSEFKCRSVCYPKEGRFTRLWIGLEQRRLEGVSHMIALVSSDCAAEASRTQTIAKAAE